MADKATTTSTIQLSSRDEAVLLFGSSDVYLRMIRDTLGVRLVARGDTIVVDGDEDAVVKAERVFQQLRELVQKQEQISPEDVRTVLEIVQNGHERTSPHNLTVQNGGPVLLPRRDGQARDGQATRGNNVTLGDGP